MQDPQLLPRLVPELPAKPQRTFSWSKFNPFGPKAPYENVWVQPAGYSARKKKMAEEAARVKALKLCPWAENNGSDWETVLKELTNEAKTVPKESKEIKFDFGASQLPDVESLKLDLNIGGKQILSKKRSEDDDLTIFTTNNSVAPTIHTNEPVDKESTPFYHSNTFSVSTKPSPHSSSSSLILTTVSRPEVKLNCASKTVYSVKRTKPESTLMQKFTALNNTVNSRGQTIFAEKVDGKFYLWASHHSAKAAQPDKYWFYVVRHSVVSPDGDLIALIFAELTPVTGWKYDPEMHYKGQFYITKVKPMTKKQAFDSETQENPPRADKLIYINKRTGLLPMLEVHSGQAFVSYKDPVLNYNLTYVDWDNQKLWEICHVVPYKSPDWNASQTRPIPILFNGGMYLIESTQIVKFHVSFKGDTCKLISMRKWKYDKPLVSRAILWADHLDAKHVVLHHSQGYHIYDMEKQQHVEANMDKERPYLWSLVDGKVHKFGYTQGLLDKIEQCVAKRKLQAGDKVEF